MIRRFVAILAIAAAQLFAAPAEAAFGDRDCTFGNAGVAPIPTRGYPSYYGTNDAFDLAIEQDGNILVRQGDINNYSWLQRLGPSGTPLSMPLVGGKSPGKDATMVSVGTGQILVPIGFAEASTGAILRILQSGQVDTTFGSNGYANAGNFKGSYSGPVVQPDGKILVGGISWDTPPGSTTAALARFNADGSPDLAFGTGGYVNNFTAVWAYWSIALQPDGKILGMGVTTLTRHLANGAVDTTFGSGGTVTLPVGQSKEVRIQSSGKILVTTDTYATGVEELMISRYSADGVLETSRTIDVPGLAPGQNRLRAPFKPHAMFLMADDRPVLFGAVPNPGNAYPGPGAIVRLTPDLMDDAHVLLDFSPNDLRVLPDGKLLAIRGDWSSPQLRRFLGDSHPATCAPTSISMTAGPNPSAYGSAVTMTATVSATSGTPLGWVVFSSGANGIQSAPVVDGVASNWYSYLSAGSHQITATYYPSGSAHLESTSAPVSQLVIPGVTLNDPTANSASPSPTMTFTVTLGGGASASTVTVDYATSDQSAIAGIDYTATSGTLTFAPGETSKPIVVPVTQKSAPSTAKKLFLTLSNPTNASITKTTATGTIVYAASGTLSLYVADASVAEGYSGTTLLGFTVSLSQPHTLSDVTVSYATANDTAIAGADYTAQSGTLTFHPGQTQQWVVVPIAGNAVAEANRTFFVNLTNASVGVIADGQGVGTIVDDDPAPAATALPMYRLYSDDTKEHLYTTDANEYAVLPSLGWVAEGTAYTMFANAGSYNGQFAIPLYRLNHPGIRQHHWTTDANEAKVLTDTGWWQYEGIPGYLLPASGAGTTPLYRLMYAYPPLHLWTTDLNEKDVLSTQYGWVYEGIVGEVLP